MRANEFDLIVVGEGFAGICAAAAAARSGMRVMLASKGPGSFVLGTGCIDLGGITSSSLAPFECSPEMLEEALAFFVELSAAAGCAYDGTGEQRMIPTVMGTFQQVSLAPRSVWKGDPRRIAKVVVVGIDTLPGFDADFVAERLYFHTQQVGWGTSYRSVAIKPPDDLQHPLTTVEIATRWDRNPAYQKAIIDALKHVVRDAELLILPGILGFQSSNQDFDQLEESIGCAICELPTMPPSVPGMRLLQHFERHLIDLGVELCTGFSVQRLCLDGDRCSGVELDTPGRPRRIHAESVVLASGRFSNLLESVNNQSHQPIRIDRELRAIRSDGSIVAGNLFVCGSGLGSGEPRHGNAMAIPTGYQAARMACKTGAEYAAR